MNKLSKITLSLLLTINYSNFAMNSNISDCSAVIFIFNNQQELLLENSPNGWRPPMVRRKKDSNDSVQKTAENYIKTRTSIIPHNFMSIGSVNKKLYSDKNILHTLHCLQTNSFGNITSDLSQSTNFDWFHHTKLPEYLDTNIFKPHHLCKIMKKYETDQDGKHQDTTDQDDMYLAIELDKYLL